MVTAMEESPTSLKGYFLIAMPALVDPNFRQSVTCISEHNDNGAVGIVISQVHAGLSARMIFEELGIYFNDRAEKIPIHIGGPVHTNELFVLHGSPLRWEDTLIISEHLALSNSKDILEAIAQGAGPAEFVIALGCAGWAPGQLEWELSQNAWLVCPSDKEIIFGAPIENRWMNAIQKMGIDPQSLSYSAGRA